MKKGFLNSSSGGESKLKKPENSKDAPDRIPTTPPPPPPPPAAPAKPTVSVLGVDSANFTWGANANDCRAEKGKRDEEGSSGDEGKEPTGGRIEGGEEDVPTMQTYSYNLVVEEQGAKGEAVTVQGDWDEALLDGKGGYTAMVKELKPGMEYCVHVEVVCKIHGAIKGESEKLSMPPACPLAPAPPSVSGKGKTWIKLRWSAPNGRGEAVTSYKVEMGELGRTDGSDGQGGAEVQAGVVVYSGAETKCEVKGLRPGVLYRARVLAVNAVGESEYSDFTSVPTASTVPAAPPQPYVAQLGLEWMVVAWEGPQDDGGAAVDSYTLEVHDGSEEGFMVKYNGPESQFLLTKVDCGHKYGLRVKASNANGMSPFSPVLEATGVCGPPSPPGPVTLASHPSPHSLKITWAAPSNVNGSPVQLYQVAMRRVMDGMAVGFFEVVYNGPATACEIANLFPATLYEFGVVAISALGSSAPSQCAALSTAGSPPAPPPPPFLMGCDEGRLHVGWTLPDLCNGAPVLSFQLEAVQQDGAASLLYEGSSLSHWVDGLAPGVTMACRVAATNAHGTGPASVPACFTTPCVAPSPPQAVAAAGCGKNQAQVWWSAPYSDGGSPLVSYRVQLTRKEGTGQDTLVSEVEAMPATFEGLPLGTTYRVQVMAMNAVGGSAWSEPTTLMTDPAPPGAPEPPVVGAVESDAVALSWTAPTCHRAAPVEAFTLQMHDGTQFATIYSGSLLSFRVAGLAPGAQYRFRLRAANCKGEGPFSGVAQASTNPVVPGPPLALTLVSVSGAAIKLKWAPPAFDGGSSAHAYSVLMTEVGEAGPGGAGADGGKAKKKAMPQQRAEVWSGHTTSCKVKASPETVYEVVVVAHNQVGEGAASAPLRISTPASAAAPVAPKAPSAMAAPHLIVKAGGVAVSWIPPKDAVPPARLFHLEVVSAADGKVVETYTGAATSREVGGLAAGASYAFRVAAQNDVGQGPWSSAASAQMRAAAEKRCRAAPPAPTGLELEKATKSSLRVRWSAGEGAEGGCSFKLELGEGSGSYELAYTGSDPECTVMKLKPNTRYRARVHAFNKAGASGFCEEENFRTLALPAGRSWYRKLGYLFTALIICIIIYWIMFL